MPGFIRPSYHLEATALTVTNLNGHHAVNTKNHKLIFYTQSQHKQSRLVVATIFHVKIVL